MNAEIVRGYVIGEYCHHVRLVCNGEIVQEHDIPFSDIVTTLEDAAIKWAKEMIAARFPILGRTPGKQYSFDVEYQE